jgi:FKBP-type peptidyl-prolyl cis-trans isomerase FklB
MTLWALAAFVVVLPAARAAEGPPPPPPSESPLKDLRQRASYSLGMNTGMYLKSQGADVDLDLLLQGIKDTLGLSTNQPLLSVQQMKENWGAYQVELRKKQADRDKAFLVENAKKPGVVQLPSGLQYKVIAAGTGKSPTTNDVVQAHYRGTLIDGTEFDNSYTRGQPMTTPLTRLIPGWTEALLKMKVGDRWELCIPSELAYRERGRPPRIPPNATLLFEMELVGIVDPKDVPTTPGPTGVAPSPGGGVTPGTNIVIRPRPGTPGPPVPKK